MKAVIPKARPLATPIARPSTIKAAIPLLRQCRRAIVPPALGIAVALLLYGMWPLAPALAHGFGERYDLPLPLRFFVIAGAAAVALSFAVAAAFLRADLTHHSYPRINLLRLAPVRWLASPGSLNTLRVLSVLFAGYVILAALIGSPRAALNPAPAVIYVAFWVALSFFTALFGNLWALVNPWKAAWSLIEQLADRQIGGRFSYPARLGAWPAVAVFLAFAILETVLADTAGPRILGGILIAYTAWNFVGMYLFGCDPWLRNAEGFTLVYGFIARFSITAVRAPADLCPQCSSAGRCRSPAGDCVDCYECFARTPPAQRQFNLRPPVVGLNDPAGVSWPGAALIILLLSTVSFDGLSATPEWLLFSSAFIIWSSSFGEYVASLIGVLGLPLLFGALYAAICALIALSSGRPQPPPSALMRLFVLSLLPIALAYHFAHFLGFLLVNGQQFIVLLSDPFGWDWNLFGTAHALPNIGILSPVFIWYFSITAIVIGHIAGVYLAHVQAMRIYAAPRPALLSQLPMLALMVCYTGASLWIISRPIAE